METETENTDWTKSTQTHSVGTNTPGAGLSCSKCAAEYYKFSLLAVWEKRFT